MSRSDFAPPAQAEGVEDLVDYYSPRLYEDLFSVSAISPDGQNWLRTSVDGRQVLMSLRSGQPEPERLRGELQHVELAAFCGRGMLRLARGSGRLTWFLQRSGSLPLVSTNLPADARPICSEDGQFVAYFGLSGRAPDRSHAEVIWMGDLRKQVAVPLQFPVTRAVFDHEGRVLYAVGRRDDGTSSVYAVNTATHRVVTLVDGLDAGPSRGNGFAVAPEGNALIIPLASLRTPPNSERQRPYAERRLKLYRFDLKTRQFTLLRSREGEDEIDPTVVGDQLYWVSARFTSSVALSPVQGLFNQKDVVVNRDALLPTWSPDGKRLAFVVGQFRLADLPLDLDVATIPVDAAGQTVGEPEMFIVGNNEDFPPYWSADGRWIAWHSHRAPQDLPFASAPGASDDIWLRKADDPTAKEIRLTRDLSDAGSLSWSPDGRKIAYNTRSPASNGAVFEVRISDIDPLTGAASGERRLALPSSIRSPVWVDWSPRGDLIAVEDEINSEEHSIWTVAPDGTRATRIATFRSQTFGGLCWLPDGHGLAFSALDGERMQVFTVASSGGSPVRVTDGTGNYMHPRVSPDGRWIAMSHIETTLRLQRSRLE